MESGGKLFYNLLLFERLLRGMGVEGDAGRVSDLTQALGMIDIGQKNDFYFTLRSLLVLRKEDLGLFDRAFELFWRKPGERGWHAGQARVSPAQRIAIVAPPLAGEKSEPPAAKAEEPGGADEPPMVEATLTYSDRETLRRKDFAELEAEELETIRRFLARLAWQIGERKTRRFEAGGGRRLDLRHMLRRNMRYGGEVLDWPHKQVRTRPRPLIILADISGSMERYTRLLLHFAYGLSRGFNRGVETFVFSTRLTRITHSLQTKDVDQALAQVAQQVPDWSGGTRIGEALKEFNFGWSRRVLGHGAVVLLISDGWDCGDDALLREEIARLQRSCHRLIWLNPLLGGEDYEPLARGMHTALPYIDDFLPVHNLASLEDLAVHLRKIKEERPVRRQVMI
jgi:uncharacterized protein with von Willebrand factor type A (vWA) domain